MRIIEGRPRPIHRRSQGAGRAALGTEATEAPLGRAI